MADIHPSAVIAEGAQIGAGCSIGPFCVIGPDVVLAERVILKSHVVIEGDTHIGADTVIFPFAVIGEIPQDLKFDGEKTRLRIGARNRIREHVTMHRGLAEGENTVVGDGNMMMVNAHIAHDCIVGNHCI
ncbi:MAG: acyl-[acyl-carrier-protein]--UDP-N-acetylglucosamine O-acyltransferase, partial [Paracoccaceae bacterium]|nr:acyl-[acyl-carrier-protein]--UDP-N-acetylglucosamine O-acyltransferase [Paracoccaceae bacterium]